MEARHLDFAAGVIHFEDGEIPGKKYGRDVILPEAAEDVLKRLALAHPEGPLFRNENGKPWTKRRRELPLPAAATQGEVPQSTAIPPGTRRPPTCLENGGSAGAVATLLGHRDPTVVLKFYGKHIEQRAEHLRGLMNGTGPSR